MFADIKFDFITDADLRRALESDYREMRLCAEHGAWKAVHVLAGSVVEAVLVEYLAGSAEQADDPLAMSLGTLIAHAKKVGAVSQKTSELSSAVKEYRNLIHPGRVKRLGEIVDENGAVVAQALVGMIVRDVSATQQKEYGFTAEQIVNKFESDTTALGIAEHLLGYAPPAEIARLLLEVLPRRYFEVLEGISPSDAVLEGHRRLFRTAFDFAPNDVKKKVMSRHVEVIRKDAGTRVEVYEEQFFRATDLEYVTGNDRKMLVDHLLSRLKDDPSEPLIEAMEGVGKHLTTREVMPFVDGLVRLMVYRQDDDLVKSARDRLIGEYSYTTEKMDIKIAERLTAWESFFEEKDDEERASAVSTMSDLFGALSPES